MYIYIYSEANYKDTHTFVHVCLHIHTHTSIYVRIQIHRHLFVRTSYDMYPPPHMTCILLLIYTRIYLYAHAQILKCVCIYVCIYVCILADTSALAGNGEANN